MDVVGAILGIAVITTGAQAFLDLTKPIQPQILLYDGQTACGPEGPQLKLDTLHKKGEITIMNQVNLPHPEASLWVNDAEVLAIDGTSQSPFAYLQVGGGVESKPSIGAYPTPNRDEVMPQWLLIQTLSGGPIVIGVEMTPEQAAKVMPGEDINVAFDLAINPPSASDSQAAINNSKANQVLDSVVTGQCSSGEVPIFEDPAYVLKAA
jgi:hypothetical protein